MVVMVAALMIGGMAGWATGGNPARLASIRIYAWPLLAAAVVLESFLGSTPAQYRTLLAVTACLSVAAWCALNGARGGQPRFGQASISLGVGLNATVMAVNSGMPVSASALAEAGLSKTLDVARGHLYKHAPMGVHTRLRYLGDIIPVRLVRTVLSPGDLLILVGIVAVTWAATQHSPTRPVRLANLASRTLH